MGIQMDEKVTGHSCPKCCPTTRKRMFWLTAREMEIIFEALDDVMFQVNDSGLSDGIEGSISETIAKLQQRFVYK